MGWEDQRAKCSLVLGLVEGHALVKEVGQA
jgi:hypothetical protein